MNSYGVKKRFKNLLLLIVILANLAFFLFPIIEFVLTSFKPSKYLLGNLFPPLFTLEHYHKTLPLFIKPLKNSLIICGISTFMVVVISIFAAYSLTRFQYKRREDIAFFILSLYALPPIVSLIPIWYIGQNLGLLDTHVFLSIIYTLFNLSFTVWLLRGFFIGIPIEIEEASLVDGCSKIGALFKIILPLSVPGISVATIFAFIFSWSEFMYATVLTRVDAVTLPVTIGTQVSFQTFWGKLTSLTSLAIIPPLLLSIFIQRYIISGLTLGAVKE